MARTLRNESPANQSMAAYVQHQQAQREDWKRLIERRDARRTAYRNTHPPLRSVRGHSSIGLLATIATMLGAALSYVASL